MIAEETVHIVDDDAAVRRSLSRSLKFAGIQIETYASAEEFLDGFVPTSADCLVLDMHMTGMDGLELQEVLQQRQVDLQIIFLTGYGDVPVAVRAMRKGAADFLKKPADGQALLTCVREALVVDATAKRDKARLESLQRRIDALSAREREVLRLVARGTTNKVMAGELGISIKTVEAHRAHIMLKTGASSLAELVHLITVTEGPQ